MREESDNGARPTMKNTKEEPTPLKWTEEPNVSIDSHWVEDEKGNVYPRALVEINGVLFTLDQMEGVYGELREILQGNIKGAKSRERPGPKIDP